MPAITPCLWFDDEGEEAAEFYADVFDDARITGVTRFGEAGPGPAGSVLTVSFEIEGQPFLALNGGPAHRGFTEAVSFQVHCTSQEEVDRLWARLGEGGERAPAGGSRTASGSRGRSSPRSCPP